MEIYTGMDIVELSRFKKARFFSRIAELVLSPAEQKLMSESRDGVQYLASRFAAKEAVIKAVPEPISWQDFEIIKDGLKPKVVAINPVIIPYKFSLSLTHSQLFAAASVVVLL